MVATSAPAEGVDFVTAGWYLCSAPAPPPPHITCEIYLSLTRFLRNAISREARSGVNKAHNITVKYANIYRKIKKIKI